MLKDRIAHTNSPCFSADQYKETTITTVRQPFSLTPNHAEKKHVSVVMLIDCLSVVCHSFSTQMPSSGRKISLKIITLFMTSSFRHKMKFWGMFLQTHKFLSNIYRMVVWNKLNFEWFKSYSHFKMSDFGSRDSRWEREREKERERVWYRNMPCIYV